MIRKQDIAEATNEFFQRHWGACLCDNAGTPEWSQPWHLIGPMPNSDRQGCYIFLEGASVKYVGSAVRKGKGIYKECGLGYRINDYMRWAREKGLKGGQRVYEMRDSHKNITALATIGFPPGFGYLAPALEAYLIAKFKDAGLTNVHSVQ